MKSNKAIIGILALLTLVSLFLHFVRLNQSPPCLNADEAAYGYNAYSFLKTGRDEFGNPFPVFRLRSFGDFKLPFYTYATVPFVAAFGLTETAVRLPNILAAVILIWAVYFLSRQFFDNRAVSLLAAALTALSPWVNVLSMHAHEVVLATLLLTASFAFLLRFSKRHSLLDGALFALLLSLALYTYHISRLFFVFYVLIFLFYSLRNKIDWRKSAVVLAMLFAFALPFAVAEVTSPPQRLSSLLILNHPDVELKTQELKTELHRSPFSTRAFVAFDQVLKRYLTYFSPEFMIFKGDTNHRFGFEGISPLSAAEFVFIFVGLFYLLRSRNVKNRGMLLVLLAISPIPAALTWQEYALTRTYFMIVPLVLIMAYGAVKLFSAAFPYKKWVVLAAIMLYALYTYRSWEFFFYHYPRRASVVRSWQCGYKEMVNVVRESYHDYDRFHITLDNGQPYIYLLFYLKYPPADFQKVARTTEPDEYGFTQVLGFDKFVFNIDSFDQAADDGRNLFILSQSEGKVRNVPEDRYDKIRIETEEMFWVCRRCSLPQEEVKP